MDDPLPIDIFREVVPANAVSRCVILASTFRSGSSLLANMLHANGCTGIATERFADFWHTPKGELWPYNAQRFRDTCHSIFASATNGLFTCKLMWPHRNLLARALNTTARSQAAELASLFPHAKWVFLRRQDKVRQGISFWRARHTGQWRAARPGGPPPAYDHAGILEAAQELMLHDTCWQDFFSCAGIVPHVVDYEHFVAWPQEGLRRLMWFIGPHCTWVTPRIYRLSLEKQADALTERYYAQFMEELGNRTF